MTHLKNFGQFVLVFFISAIFVFGLIFLGFDPCKISSIYGSSFCKPGYVECGYFCIFAGMFPIYSIPLIISACLWKKSKNLFIETLIVILFLNVIVWAGMGA